MSLLAGNLTGSNFFSMRLRFSIESISKTIFQPLNGAIFTKPQKSSIASNH